MTEDFRPPQRQGTYMEQKIPLDHPFIAWLNQYQHEAMDNGGLMRHGVMTVSLGGIEQRYDLVEVSGIDYADNATVVWRMYGHPEDANRD